MSFIDPKTMMFVPPEGVKFRKGRTTSMTKSGVPYVSFISNARVPEGGPVPKGYPDINTAWIAFNEGLTKYLRDQKAKVVEWRVPPSDDSAGDPASGTFYRIRARLAVVKRAA